MRTKTGILLLLAVVTSLVSLDSRCWPTPTNRIEAKQGKKYRLSKRHGPWMIMVASFKEPPPGLRAKGMSPEEAADQLVYELRKKGIPAYTFGQDALLEHINTPDRQGRDTQRVYAARRGMISVLAGNYKSIDADNTKEGKIAQKSLAYVKKFYPRFLRDKDSGARIRLSPGRTGPLSGAFLTINPLLSPEEARERKHDPLLLKLNSGAEFSLLDNPGKYTLIVASFYGKSVTQVSNSKFREIAKKFKIADTLDTAMSSAWELANSLRQARNYGYLQNYEAYVFHDRYRSVVTIGAFDSPRDPRIAKLAQRFGAKRKTVPGTGKDALLAEVLTIPRRPSASTPLEKSWIFDPYPKLMEVPRIQ